MIIFAQIKSERLHNELIAAKMELKLKNELERDTFGNSIIQLEVCVCVFTDYFRDILQSRVQVSGLKLYLEI